MNDETIFILVRFLSKPDKGMMWCHPNVAPMLKVLGITYVEYTNYIVYQLPQKFEWALNIDEKLKDRLKFNALSLRRKLIGLNFMMTKDKFMRPLTLEEREILATDFKIVNLI